MTYPGVQHPTFPTAQTPMIGLTVVLVVLCKVVLFDRLREFCLNNISNPRIFSNISNQLILVLQITFLQTLENPVKIED